MYKGNSMQTYGLICEKKVENFLNALRQRKEKEEEEEEIILNIIHIVHIDVAAKI